MQRMSYHLTVQSDELVRAEFSDNGETVWRSSPLDTSQLAHIQPYLDELENSSATQTRSKLTGLGSYLYHLLFTGAVRAHFEEVVWPRLLARQDSYQLTMTLAFQSSDSYPVRQASALPWEFIYCPLAAGVFLSTDPRLAWTRCDSAYPPGADALRGITHLRVLLVHLQPTDAGFVSSTRIRNILSELRESSTTARSLLPLIRQNPTPAQLATDLTDVQPHILHLLVHGHFAPNSTRFGFVDDQGQTRWYGDRSLTDLFVQHQPRLVIVQACEGGRLADARSLAHGATRLLPAGVAAVVAMQYPITNQVGWEFSEVLYRQLADGAAVDTAVQSGRRRLAQYETVLPDDHASRDFGAVVFWQRLTPLVLQERERMTQTVTLVAPDGRRYASDVLPGTLVGEIIRAFVAYLAPSPAYSTRHTLHWGGKNRPPLDTAVTLAEAGIPDGAELWLMAERLAPHEPIGLTIEDDEGARFATAVRLNTPVGELANAFLARYPLHADQQPVVTLVTGLVETMERPLSTVVTLYEAGISHDALLRIKTETLSKKGAAL